MKANEQETMKENRGGVGVCSEHTRKMLPEARDPFSGRGPQAQRPGSRRQAGKGERGGAGERGETLRARARSLNVIILGPVHIS